jgi:subtilisin family serine protease
MTGRRLSLVLALVLTLTINAQAAGPIPVILKILPGANLSLITSLLGGTVVDTLPGSDTYLLRLPSLPVVSSLLKLLGVDWIEADEAVRLSLNPSHGLTVPHGVDPDWYKKQPSFGLVRAEAATAYSDGRGIIIADINSRVDGTHPALAGHIGAGYDFISGRSTTAASLNDDQSTAGFLDDDQSTAGFLDDDQSTAGFLDDNGIRLFDDQSTAGFLDGGASAHGTFCAGILAVVAPRATIMPLRAFDDNGNTDLFTLAKAIRYAKQNGAHVINMSFGTLTDSKVIREAIAFANSANITLVASAGNNNTSVPQFPAAYSSVLAVAATDLLDRKASFSNYGTYVFADAPGVHIISATPNREYGIANGTSFSAPMVAGTAALIRSIDFGGARTKISASTVRIDNRNPQYVGKLGYGRIDILEAVKPE